MPPDALFRDFRPTGEFDFELDGDTVDGAEVFFAERAAAYLIMASELSSPVLVSPRTQSVESVHLMKVARRKDGTIDLLADATFNRLGGFRIVGQEIVFEVKGRKAKLKPKPPLLGLSTPEELQSYKPDYRSAAQSYNPDAGQLAALKEADEARILIYFGTWCPTCGRLVPRVLRLDDELEGSKLRFEYYGLPRQIDTDPNARRDDIHGVPAGIVYVGGKEVARLGVHELNQPEKALDSILNGS